VFRKDLAIQDIQGLVGTRPLQLVNMPGVEASRLSLGNDLFLINKIKHLMHCTILWLIVNLFFGNLPPLIKKIF
jgi:hypothetical protein